MIDIRRDDRIVVSAHADEEMGEDDLFFADIEHAIFQGEIIEKQKDRITGETKYLVRGPTPNGLDAVAVVKVGPTGL